MNPRRIRSDSNIFLDESKTGACVAGTRSQVWFTAVTVGYWSFHSHAHAVFHRCIGQRLVPLQTSKSSLGASLIG